jgi:glc operon protein GlcG
MPGRRLRIAELDRFSLGLNIQGEKRQFARKSAMNSKILISVLAVALLMSVLAAGELGKPAVIFMDHDKVAAAFATGGPLLAANNFKVQAGHRTGPGEVEVHDKDTDIFHVLQGTATFVTGGKVIEPRTVSPGEIRGKELEGGEARRLVKGDVIVIPSGIPHWFKEVSGTFEYFVVKVSQ